MSACQLDDLQVAGLAFVHDETDEGADGLPALQTGGAGIDVQQAQLRVGHHL